MLGELWFIQSCLNISHSLVMKLKPESEESNLQKVTFERLKPATQGKYNYHPHTFWNFQVKTQKFHGIVGVTGPRFSKLPSHGGNEWKATFMKHCHREYAPQLWQIRILLRHSRWTITTRFPSESWLIYNSLEPCSFIVFGFLNILMSTVEESQAENYVLANYRSECVWHQQFNRQRHLE